ncbi:MAG: HNH endonuclease [Lachnospiraceae bacterium]|jgi:hypothetical protein
MIGNFNDVKESQMNRFVESPLGKKAESSVADKYIVLADKSLAFIYDKFKCCPVENGKWTGERGDSKWCPDKDYIPGKANPDGKNWGEILKKFGIDGIEYRNGEPDFSRISKETVKIKDFCENRADNFDKADIALAKQQHCSPDTVKKWRKENAYTWHECKDMKTMQLVPSVIHNNMSHSGGISEAKKGA